MEIKWFIQFEIIINVLVSSFRVIWIPMLWVYGLYKYYNSFTAEIDFRRQILTSKVDLHTERDKGRDCFYDWWYTHNVPTRYGRTLKISPKDTERHQIILLSADPGYLLGKPWYQGWAVYFFSLSLYGWWHGHVMTSVVITYNLL